MSSIIFNATWPRVALLQMNHFRRHFSRSVTLNAEVKTGSPAVTATNRAQLTAKRFWKNVDIEERPECLVVTLDKRPLKTPEGALLAIPKSKKLLAALIAHEWDNQLTIIKPFALPMTSLAARAIDNSQNASSQADVKSSLLKYLDTDTICFFSDDPPDPLATDQPPTLFELQQKYWAPLVKWAENEFNVEIKCSGSVMLPSQPKETRQAFGNFLESLDTWKLASAERAVYAAKSLIIGLALIKGHLSAEEAAQAAQVEVVSQIERWGEVEDTHDVDFQEIRRQLSSAACLLVDS